jgi:hypothetical protein
MTSRIWFALWIHLVLPYVPARLAAWVVGIAILRWPRRLKP